MEGEEHTPALMRLYTLTPSVARIDQKVPVPLFLLTCGNSHILHSGVNVTGTILLARVVHRAHSI